MRALVDARCRYVALRLNFLNVQLKTQLAKMSIDLKFVELTANVLEIFFIKYTGIYSFI